MKDQRMMQHHFGLRLTQILGIFAALVCLSRPATAQVVITTPSPLPPAEVGVFYAQQLTSTASPAAQWTVLTGSLPAGMSLTIGGYLSGTPTAAGTFDFNVQVADGLQKPNQTFRLVVNAALDIATSSPLPDALLSSPYTTTLTATGGLQPYTWSSPKPLPAGLSLSSSGLVSGIPTGVGTFSFQAQVQDSYNPRQQSVRTFSVTVTSPLSITTTALPHAIQNGGYSFQMQATGGTGPYTWVVSDGSLPATLTLSTSGVVSGLATTAAVQDVVFTVTDSRGTTAVKGFTFATDPPISSFTTTGLSSSVKPAQQTAFGLQLTQPHPSPLTGTLNLSFTSKAEVLSDDPMVQFSNGSRSVSFIIPANTTTASFTSSALLLSGTVAGTIRLTANIDNGPQTNPVATVDIQALPPQITNVEAIRTTTGLDVFITGYSPTRRVSSVDFTFEIKNGSKTQHVTLSRNVDALFSGWFGSVASVAYGSAFSFTQSFTVQGSGSIQSVTVTLKNPQGNTASAVITPK